MKKSVVFLFTLALALSLNSCYTYTHTVGNGPQNGETVTKKNHYFIYGLAKGNLSDPNEMAENADDYEVTIQHTFVDGLLNVLTFGIYTPTTTTVKK